MTSGRGVWCGDFYGIYASRRVERVSASEIGDAVEFAPATRCARKDDKNGQVGEFSTRGCGTMANVDANNLESPRTEKTRKITIFCGYKE